MMSNNIASHTRSLSLAVFQIVAVLFSVTVGCIDAEAGEFTIKPSLILREAYDDNIFLTQDNKESDYITQVLPSVNMTYTAPVWQWTLDYTLNWWYYANLGETKDSHYAKLVSKTKVIENFLYLDVFDSYTSVVLNERRAYSESNLFQNRSDTNTLSASPYIKYQIDPSLILTGGYRYTNIWYREDQGINRQLHTGYVSGEYKISPVLTLQAGADYTADMPEDPDPDDNQMSLSVGAIYKIGPKMTLDGNLGYRWVDFDSEDEDDERRPLYNIGLVYLLAEQGQIEIRALSSLVMSPSRGLYDSRLEQVAVRYGEAFSIKGSIFHRYDKYLQEDRKDDIYGVTAGLEYRPDQRLTFGIGGRYEHDKYKPENEKRNIYAASLGVDYKLAPRATAGVMYNYTKSDGDRPDDNYTENIVGIQLRLEI